MIITIPALRPSARARDIMPREYLIMLERLVHLTACPGQPCSISARRWRQRKLQRDSRGLSTSKASLYVSRKDLSSVTGDARDPVLLLYPLFAVSLTMSRIRLTLDAVRYIPECSRMGDNHEESG